MKKVLNEHRLCELAGLQKEADTEEMPAARDLTATHKLTPVEFKKELARAVEIEKYTEKDLLNAWRAWSAAVKKAEEANKPPPPVTANLPPADAQQSLTATQDIDYDPDPTGEEFAKKWSGRKYVESDRLFRLFFRKYLNSANQPGIELYNVLLKNENLLDIIIQLYGWQLPKEFRTTDEFGDLPDIFGARIDPLTKNPLHVKEYEDPGTEIMKFAQEFEAEDKPIEGNEEEFLDRVQSYQYKTGKAQFEPQRKTQSQDLAVRKALADIIEKHKKDPRFADLYTPLEGEEGGLPPLEHAGGHGMRPQEYARYLINLFPDEYADLYKKHLDTLLS